MAKAIMVQGTMSNAGKSLLAAGLCRIFRQDGLRTAPFKSQNMALNSFITRDGLEMGRAQVMQAEAAGIEPSVLMNPILLKPTSDVGSQVIVNGEVLGNMRASEYFRRKREFVPVIEEAYHKLESQFDVIVLEGAGSPAEINLKQNDIVNMGMAKIAKAPVLLVGDIDRGGVFASLVGTMILLEPEERAMVKATIINKFRGDKKLLEPGLQMLEDRIHIPAAGVVPYTRLDIDDEDSLSDRFERRGASGPVEIAVIRLPHISNFTDFAVLESNPLVSLRYVGTRAELGTPDLLLLPGTKNTMGDLIWLRESGLEAEILKYAAAGGIVFGICGGFQMMGRTLSDPLSVEHGGTVRGMGLLPAETVFSTQKTRMQAEGIVAPLDGFFAPLSGKKVSGYEIHMGVTNPEGNARPFCTLRTQDGAAHPDGILCGNCGGTYLHGIFDTGEVTAALINALLRRKGLPETARPLDLHTYKEQQYDLLADTLRENLDMKLIYRILEEGIA